MHATYDRRVDALSVRARDGQPKYVVVGKGTFVIFADDDGIWQIDLEAETWDTNPDRVFKKMKIDVINYTFTR